MSENGKTLTYVGVALAIGVVVILTRPNPEPPQVDQIVGKPLFEKFTDPAKASSLEIVKYDEQLGEPSKFKVAKTSEGLWSIPSHGNYPADAENQMKEAATSLIGLTVLGVASQDQADHELYGVVEPSEEKLKAGAKGVGVLVSFQDDAGASLGSLIIGKEVKNNPDQRFVRVPRQDQVAVVKISPTKLSTKFEDWIEKDLLKVNALDVDRLRLKDHSVVRTAQGYVAEPRAEVTVSLDPNGAQWKLDEMLVYKDSGPQKTELLPGEELNKEKLDGLKSALAEIKIADVYTKPKGLDATLKTSGDFLNDREAQRSLADRGFVLAQDNEIWSANGELQVRTKDGVEYVLRFGNVSGEQQDSKGEKLNRFLFVMARVDESKFPKPTLEEVPNVPAAPASATPAPSGTAPAAPAAGTTATEKPATPDKSSAEKSTPEKTEKADTKKADTEKADTKKADTKKADTEKADTEKEEKPDGANCTPQEPPAVETKDNEKSDADKAKSPATTDQDSPVKDAGQDAPEKKDADAKEGDSAKKDATAPTPPSADKAPAGPLGEDEVKRKKLEAERDRIDKENQRKLDKWKDDKAKAEEKVRELNSRFAPWYYVISEDVYKKIHLSHSDILREGSKSAEEGTGLDAFRKLEKDGLKKAAPPGFHPPGPGSLPPGLQGIP